MTAQPAFVPCSCFCGGVAARQWKDITTCCDCGMPVKFMTGGVAAPVPPSPKAAPPVVFNPFDDFALTREREREARTSDSATGTETAGPRILPTEKTAEPPPSLAGNTPRQSPTPPATPIQSFKILRGGRARDEKPYTSKIPKPEVTGAQARNQDVPDTQARDDQGAQPSPSRHDDPSRDRPAREVREQTQQEAPNEDQARALALLKEGKNVFLTGSGGTGKSRTVEWFREWCLATGKRLAVTASTGIASLNVGGKTIHSWAGMFPGKYDPVAISSHPRWRKTSLWSIKRAQVLLIDEISCVDARTLDCLEALIRLAHGQDGEASIGTDDYTGDPIRERMPHEQPWGGIQIVFVGDMGQLPPVELETNGYPFQSPAWAAARFETVELQAVMRQSDATFIRVLQEVRLGRLSEEGTRVLSARVRAYDPENPDTPAVRLCTHNADVDKINAKKLASLPEPEHAFEATESAMPNTAGTAALEKLDKNCLSPKVLRLRLGARVMLTRNADRTAIIQYVNGSTGTVVDLSPHTIRVKLDRTGQVLDVQRATWAIEGRDESDILASRTQFPLRLSWATSIHKSQSQSLDRVSVDLAKVFANGQSYVALSRCRTLEGLTIERWNGQASISASPAVLAFISKQRSAGTW